MQAGSVRACQLCMSHTALSRFLAEWNCLPFVAVYCSCIFDCHGTVYLFQGFSASWSFEQCHIIITVPRTESPGYYILRVTQSYVSIYGHGFTLPSILLIDYAVYGCNITVLVKLEPNPCLLCEPTIWINWNGRAHPRGNSFEKKSRSDLMPRAAVLSPSQSNIIDLAHLFVFLALLKMYSSFAWTASAMYFLLACWPWIGTRRQYNPDGLFPGCVRTWARYRGTSQVWLNL